MLAFWATAFWLLRFGSASSDLRGDSVAFDLVRRVVIVAAVVLVVAVEVVVRVVAVALLVIFRPGRFGRALSVAGTATYVLCSIAARACEGSAGAAALRRVTTMVLQARSVGAMRNGQG